jgi:acyl carrier protein
VRAPCDVTDVSAVRELVMASRAYGTLRGVIHAAGRLDDGAIVNLSPERFARVLAPKVDGIRALEAALRGTDLDVLVLASSAASVLGSPGQGNYCAGNAYLDAFALARRDVAKRVVSLSWGPWAGDGMAQVDGQATADRFGLAMIPPQIGAALSVRAMSAPSGHYLVTAFDPLAVGRALSPGRLSPLLSGLAATAGHELFERAPARAAPRPALSTEFVAPRTVVEERLAEIFTGVLGATGLGVRDDLFELGGDSISATQILSLANQAFGVRLPGEAAFACFTIEGLAELVESALLDRIADLDEAEVERLLAAGEI